jgi:hypothetical protein
VPREPKPAAELIARYTAPEMPLPVLERLQTENCEAFSSEEIDSTNAFRIANLLLSIALMKLQTVTA